MLLYAPPFPMVDGLTALPDHADPETFYYLVAVPELVREPAGPAFWATAILPEVSTGTEAATKATMSFDVELAATVEGLNKLGKEIQRQYGREAKRLVPAPLHSGTVSLDVLRPGAADSDFTVYTGHSPALFGANRAAFALAAQNDEAQALIASLTVGHVPAVLSYSLEFLGLAPSFRARMTVHWSSVYHKLSELERSNFVFVAEEMDRVCEELRQFRAIEIEVSELDPEGAKAATTALFNELKSQVVAKLFETPRQVGETPIEDRIGRGVRNVLTAIMPGVSHSLRTVDETQLQDTVIDLNEQQVNIYPFHPQSTLAGIGTRAGGIADRLHYIRLDELPFRTEEIAVELAAGADLLGVRSVELWLTAHAPGRAEPLLDKQLRLDATEPKRELLRFRREGTAEPAVRWRAEMQMDPSVAPDGQELFRFDWQDLDGGRLWFDPEEWLDVTQLRLEIDDPAVFENAKVEMAIEATVDGQAEPFRHAQPVFTAEASPQVFSVVLPEGKAVRFSGSEIFRQIGQDDFVRPVPEISGPVHRIRNPYGQSWSMEVRAIADWSQTDMLVTEFRVWDVAREVWLTDEHTFGKDNTTWTARFRTSVDTPRDAQTRVTRVGVGDVLVRGPWQDVTGAVCAVRDTVRAQRRIRATLSAPGWVRDDVRNVKVELEYNPGGIPAQTATLEFTGDGEVRDWTHDFPEPARPKYRYRLRAFGRGGERYNGPWAEAATDDLALALPDPLWT